MDTPLEAAKQVEADFKSYKGTPIWPLIERAHRLHGGSATADKSEASIRQASARCLQP